MIRRLISYTLVRATGLTLLLLMAAPVIWLAEAAPPPSAIAIGAPVTVTLGEVATLQARLVDDAGAPIANAPVYFVVPSSFLNVDGDVVVARGVTDKAGLASAQWEVRSSGDLTVRAEFRGDERHGKASASTRVTEASDQQLYVQHAGVQVPGLNSSPVAWATGLWPALSAWPVVLALLVVWSLYGRVAFLLIRLAREPATVASPALELDGAARVLHPATVPGSAVSVDGVAGTVRPMSGGANPDASGEPAPAAVASDAPKSSAESTGEAGSEVGARR